MRVLTIAAVLCTVLGLLCLNYTSGMGYDHHVEWAGQHGMPGPGPLVFDAGLVLTPLGAAVVGFVIGRRRRSRAAGGGVDSAGSG